MKDLKEYIEECGAAPAGGFGPVMATPGNTMGAGNPALPGMGDPDAPGSEGIPTAKAKKEDVKKKRKRNKKLSEAQVNEFAMKFNKKNFLAELSTLMTKYKVRLVHDVEGSYFEDESGNMVLDLTDKFITPEKMKEIAVKEK